MSENYGCLACETVAGTRQAPGGIIFENEHWVIDHHFAAVMTGFLIIKARRHCEQIAELSPEELSSFGRVLSLTTRALTEVLAPAKIYVCSWGESAGGHVHWCVIPRYGDMRANGIEVVSTLWDGRWGGEREAAAALASRVRETIVRVQADS